MQTSICIRNIIITNIFKNIIIMDIYILLLLLLLLSDLGNARVIIEAVLLIYIGKFNLMNWDIH